MKKKLACQQLATLALFLLLASNIVAQQLTQTVTTLNRNCNSGCSVLDVAALTSNTSAIILITQVPVNGMNMNPHTVGAYYMYLNKWSIFNLDATAIVVGAQYNVEYWLTQDANHFVYVIPQRVNITDVSYIDHAGLNNNPNAQIRVCPHVSYISGALGNLSNRYEVKVQYDPAVAKWFIANTDGTAIPSSCAYNIVFANSGGTTDTNPAGGSCNCTSLPPNGPAGGDLGGTYPNPNVKGLQGYPVSTTPPTLGQVLKWDGTAWVPGDDNTGNAGVATSIKPSVQSFVQDYNVGIYDENSSTIAISGLNNRTFTLAQNSHIVFNTNILGMAMGGTHATGVQLVVQILNAANQVVGISSSSGTLQMYVLNTIISMGVAVLPAGTYHTKVVVNRQAGGDQIYFAINQITGQTDQYGSMIIEIFPD